MADSLAIETSGLHKSYGSVEAVRGLDLCVPAGSIFGFLGRNGAGKTTTIKILLGMAHPTSGDARVFGLRSDADADGVEIRRRTGFVSEEKDLYDSMTVDGIIRFTSTFYPRWRRDLEQRYLRSFDLRADAKVKTLSRGTRTKLALLLALCRGAELLVLDEPTSGLDPAMSDEVLQILVSHVANQETTVFFSSHQIAEVEQIAESVAIVDRGRTVLAGALDDFRESYRRIHLVFEGDAPEPAFRSPGIVRVRREGRVLTIVAIGGADDIASEARAMNAASVTVVPMTLKDIFLDAVAEED